MNQRLFETHWYSLRGQIKDWWSQLTDTDLDRVGGNFEQFLGLLQMQYAYSHRRAAEEFYRHMALRREAQTQAQPKAEPWAKFSQP